MPQPKTMKGGSPDNFQTEPSALDCLIPYLKGGSTVWEPACGNGNLVKKLQQEGFYVFPTDIKSGTDFLTYNSPGEDYIITNPPFSLKEEFLGRCYQIGKPFALLMPITTFDSVQRRKMMAQYGCEIIFPEKRINFETPNHERNVAAGKRTNSWFYTAWFTCGLNIGRQLVFTDPQLLGI